MISVLLVLLLARHHWGWKLYVAARRCYLNPVIIKREHLCERRSLLHVAGLEHSGVWFNALPQIVDVTANSPQGQEELQKTQEMCFS